MTSRLPQAPWCSPPEACPIPTRARLATAILLAERLGHRIVPPAPGLVPLVASDPWIPALAGVSLTDVGLRAIAGAAAPRAEHFAAEPWDAIHIIRHLRARRSGS